MTQCGKNSAVRTWMAVPVEKDVAALWKDFFLQSAVCYSPAILPLTALKKKLKINSGFMHNKNFMCHKSCFSGTARGSLSEPHLLDLVLGDVLI